MKNLIIKEIINACNGKLICGNNSQEVEGFSKDTREIEKGYIYVGIQGENFDGNSYYKQAIANGAVGCILEEHYEGSINLEEVKNSNIIIVKDSVKALQDIARYRRSQYNIPVVAITGSVGKTSTKDIIANTLAQKFNVLKTEGNNNNHIGLPLTLLRLKEQNMITVEMGMNHLGEISVLTNIAKPNVCVITNVGTAHIGNLGSRENILKAKLEILEGMDNDGIVIVNNDNDLLHTWAEENKNNYNIITYGIHNTSDYMAYNIKETDTSVEYKIKLIEGVRSIKVPVSGEPFVYNSLCALAVAKVCNVELDKAINGIANFELTKKRMEITKKDGVTIINDSYNASYDSMKAALEYLKITTGDRKIAVLGDMLELGDFEQELHEKVGEEFAKNSIDVLITIGERAKYIAQRAKEIGCSNIYSYTNKEKATEVIKAMLKENDVILFKASNSMKLSQIIEKL